MSFAKSENFTSCFSTRIPFILLSTSIAVARILKIMFNNRDENGHSSLVPDCRRNDFRFSLLKIIFAVCVLYMDFIMF